ncbi:MAG TPA: type II secretion system protein [Chthoniobacteraceae bacterium]|nr:type II secretion system protein [Chthoniobacteraceae bacterium]
MMFQPPSKPRAGFTVVEILVVTVLTAVLAVLLFPAGNRAVKAARESECRTRLKMLGAAHLAYAADRGGRFISSANPGGKEGYWFDVLGRYMAGEQVTWVNGKQGGTIESIPKWLTCPEKPGEVGYGWNQKFGKQSYDETKDGYHEGFRRLITVTRPAETVLHADSKDPGVEPGLRYENWYLYSSAGWKARFPARHLGKGNYFFVDGHMEAITPAGLLKRLEIFDPIKPD